MKIKDKEIKKLLSKARSIDLDEQVYSYPEDEIEGQTEMEIFLNELDHLITLYHEEGTVYRESLEEAKAFIKETKNGKVIPCYSTIPPVPKYTALEFEFKLKGYKAVISEYNRLTRMAKKLGIK